MSRPSTRASGKDAASSKLVRPARTAEIEHARNRRGGRRQAQQFLQTASRGSWGGGFRGWRFARILIGVRIPAVGGQRLAQHVEPAVRAHGVAEQAFEVGIDVVADQKLDGAVGKVAPQGWRDDRNAVQDRYSWRQVASVQCRMPCSTSPSRSAKTVASCRGCSPLPARRQTDRPGQSARNGDAAWGRRRAAPTRRS